MSEYASKPQALYAFWSMFGWDAYDENTVPDNIGGKYITFESATGSLGDTLYLSARLWHTNATNYDTLEAKVKEIADKISIAGYDEMRINGGRMIIRRGSPFSQNMQDGIDRRALGVLLNITVEFITA